MVQHDEETPDPGEVSAADCPDCQRAEAGEATGFVRPVYVTDRALVLGWPNLQPSSPRKHHVDRTGIAATYRLTTSTKVRCSLGHDHTRGAVVVTRCGLTLLLGWKCAQNAVHGAAELEQFAAATEAHFMKLARVRRVPGECVDRLAFMVKQLEVGQHFKTARWDTAFGLEMRRRANSPSPRDAEVTFKVKVLQNQKATDLGTPNFRIEDQTAVIAGLPFWTALLPVDAAKQALVRAKELVEEVRKLDPEDSELLDEVARRTGYVEAAVDRFVVPVDLCLVFLGANNLRLAGIAAGSVGQTDTL